MTAIITTSIPSPLLDRYRQVRQTSANLCRPLAIEDYTIQSMPDVSPPKWHLAHTTWFFETFVLMPNLPDYALFDRQFGYLFNSYYEAVGSRHPRHQRGLLSRPTVAQIENYRGYVDAAMERLLATDIGEDLAVLIGLGLHHEQQHQELLVTDIKHILALNPTHPIYRDDLAPAVDTVAAPLTWLNYPSGVYEIGHQGPEFAFDNESPRHKIYLPDYQLGSRLVTNGEYLEFMQSGGYQQAQYWLAEGWAIVRQAEWQSPLYWEQIDGAWYEMTLGGLQPLNLHAPVCHVSYYEADAYAAWCDKSLPTEAEWEVAAANLPLMGNFLDSDRLHPTPATKGAQQWFGDVWEWTQSAYLPYPGFKIAEGAIGEYNGKFMCNQMVLRGGSCATPANHMRSTYRNFFPPSARWQFSGIRLANRSV